MSNRMNIDQAIESLDLYERKSKHFYDLGYLETTHLRKQRLFAIAHKYNLRVRELSKTLEFVYNRAEQEENYKNSKSDMKSFIGSRLRFVK